MDSTDQEAVARHKTLNRPIAESGPGAAAAGDGSPESPVEHSLGQRVYAGFAPYIDKVRRRPLFQKVVIANSFLIVSGAVIGFYLEQRYFEGGEIGFLVLFMFSGLTLSILLNYIMVKLAFRPLDDVSETMKAIRAGHRGIRVPEVTDDPQVEELSKSLNSMLNSLELQRKRAAASVIKAQEEERKRIARELHDETSQSLTGLVIGIRMVEELVPDSIPEIKERLDNINNLAHQTLNEVHHMAVRLRPSVLDDLGLSAALRSYGKEFTENTGIPVDVQLLAM
ncbi:MAG: histidine kinase, partial [Thermoleophilia bacterium]